MASSFRLLLVGEVFFNFLHVLLGVNPVSADPFGLGNPPRVMLVIDAVVGDAGQASYFVQGIFVRHVMPSFLSFIRVWLQGFWRKKFNRGGMSAGHGLA